MTGIHPLLACAVCPDGSTNNCPKCSPSAIDRQWCLPGYYQLQYLVSFVCMACEVFHSSICLLFATSA